MYVISVSSHIIDCIEADQSINLALVVMDRQDYIKTAKNLLEDTTTYRPIQADPTNKYKAKLINILKNIKAETGINDYICRRMYTTGASSPKFYGLPKFIRKLSASGPLYQALAV